MLKCSIPCVLCIGIVAMILFQTIPAQIICIFGTSSQPAYLKTCKLLSKYRIIIRG